jgi:hypothetical protein
VGRTAAPLSRSAVLAVARRPDLWAVALGQAARLAPGGWWRRWPPVPTPPAGYLRFRMQTQYGDGVPQPDGADLVQYLEWCRAERSRLRGNRSRRRRGRR